jgi:preprotein translocase subunit SecD
VAPPSTQASRPGRYLAALLIIVIAMLAGIVGKNITSPGDWHKDFRVGLGLDLSSGSTVTLKAVTEKKGAVPSAAAMKEASSIMLSRVNGAGFTGAQVQQQGNDIITVSVPGKQSRQVVNLVGTTALLRFRQVLLQAPNYTTGTSTTPTPSASPSPSTSAGAKPSPSSSASPSTSASTKAGSNGTGKSVRAVRLSAAGTGARKAAAASSASPVPSSSASPASSASPSPGSSASPASTAPAKPVLSTTKDATGDASLVNSQTAALFNKLNCGNKNWQAQIYHNNPVAWDDTNSQIVACSGGYKYVLDVAKVTGQQVTSASGGLDSTNGKWVVNLNFNGQATKAFGTLTSNMYSKYFNPSTGQQTSVLDNFAIVLDGKIVSIAYVSQPITTGQGQISGSFTEAQVNNLANVLKYGSLPLTFTKESITSVSAQLGSAQLQAGLVAAAVGLLLVVLYSFLYYRGLGLVSVSSLIVAALLSYLSVVLLSKYEGFTLSLAGVAGLIVAIGITADSFVVYFERLRDEVREGRSLRAAVERGWQRARRTILVSDTVSFLAAALLYFFAIGDVKGFAFTLGLTTLIDIVVVFLFTKPMVTLLARTKFYGQGHKWSGLDPARLGARSPWRGAKRIPARPAPSGARASGSSGQSRLTPGAQAPTSPKEA